MANVRRRFIGAALIASLLWSAQALAHCDALDGPVVAAARKALDRSNANLILIWGPEGG
jgi:hypothetical protein